MFVERVKGGAGLSNQNNKNRSLSLPCSAEEPDRSCSAMHSQAATSINNEAQLNALVRMKKRGDTKTQRREEGEGGGKTRPARQASSRQCVLPHFLHRKGKEKERYCPIG